MSYDKSGRGSVTVIFAILLATSVALNVALFSGCITLPEQPKPEEPAPVQDNSRDFLIEIASILGVRTSEDDSVYDIVVAIRSHIIAEGVPMEEFPKELLTDEVIDTTCTMLKKEDRPRLQSYQQFIKSLEGKSLEGKRFIVIP